MYNDSNSLGDRAKEGRGSKRRHARTGEGISARTHVENSHGDKAKEGQRSDRKHSANSLWERDESCMSVGVSIASQSRSGGFNRSWKSIVIKKKLRRERTASVGVTPLNCTLGRYPNGIFATCKRGGFVLQRATKPAKELIAQNPPQDCIQTRATSGLVFAKQAAAADVPGGCSRWQRAGSGRKQAGLVTRQGARQGAKNGEQCKMRVFRCYGSRSRAAGSRRTVTGKSGLPELALLLSG